MNKVSGTKLQPSRMFIWISAVATLFGACLASCNPASSPTSSHVTQRSPSTKPSSTSPTEDVARERREKLERAIAASEAVEAFLGVDGELVFLGKNDFARGVGVRFAVMLNDPGLELMNLSDWQGGNMWNTYATVTREGIVSYHTGGQKSAELSAAPHTWTVKDGSGILGLPTTGTVLCEEGAKSGPLAEPPSGNAGWVMLGYGGLLFTPPSQDNRPPNVLWVMLKKEGGFDLVHSGPLHQGIYATIQADRRIVLGTGADGLVTFGDERTRWWRYVDYDTEKPMMPPPGFTGSIYGTSSPKAALLFKNGQPYVVSEGDRIINSPSVD